MSRGPFLANSILWATAILASAIMKAPVFLTLVLLPSLAVTALFSTRPGIRARACL
jgi:hypothetical protein